MIRKISALTAILCAFHAGGAELNFTPSGIIKAEEVEFKLFSASPGWKGAATQNEQNVTFPGEGGFRQSDGSVTRQGTFATQYYGSFQLEETRKIEGDRASIKLELSSQTGVESQLLAVVASLTEFAPFTVNGKPCAFPEIPSDRNWQAKFAAGENKIEIPLKRGLLRICGNFEGMLQDNRRFNNPTISLRMHFTPETGKITRAQLAFELEYLPYASSPVCFGGKEEMQGGIRFDVSPSPRTGTFQTGEAAGMRHLYLLGNEKSGALTIAYADGAEERRSYPAEAIPVRDDLAVSTFALTGPVKSITVEGGGVYALSLSKEKITPPREEKEWTAAANDAWRPFDFTQRVEPGSALDFSFLLDAPAGKHGFLKVVKNHFEFENQPGKPVRFWGTNLTGNALFQSNERLDQVVDILATCGYNLLRFHHFDQPLTAAMKESSQLDPEKMDRLHYLLAACKKRGMYVTIDLYMSRKLRKGEIPAYPDREIAARDFKALVMIDDDVMKNLEDYSLRLLSSVNPYTGAAWKDDPTLVAVSLINEGTLVNNIKSG